MGRLSQFNRLSQRSKGSGPYWAPQLDWKVEPSECLALKNIFEDIIAENFPNREKENDKKL